MAKTKRPVTAEHRRLREPSTGPVSPWSRWGPYVAERAWGTVREDYSENGNAWDYFSHDQARSRADRWGEDGLAGISDDQQRLCFALALWNGRDPILKERLFGLTAREGNHGEDVKEYYFYLDSTPTHSYMKMLYKYPQVAYPYDELVQVNGGRTQAEPEYELFDALHDAFLAGGAFVHVPAAWMSVTAKSSGYWFISVSFTSEAIRREYTCAISAGWSGVIGGWCACASSSASQICQPRNRSAPAGSSRCSARRARTGSTKLRPATMRVGMPRASARAKINALVASPTSGCPGTA